MEPISAMEKLAMKRSLVSLAALGFAGVASAQSSATLFGVVDTDLDP
jgi:predicted porin